MRYDGVAAYNDRGTIVMLKGQACLYNTMYRSSHDVRLWRNVGLRVL